MGLLRWIMCYGNPIIRFANNNEDFSSDEGQALVLETDDATLREAFRDLETWTKLKKGFWGPNYPPLVQKKIRRVNGDLARHPSLS